MEYTIRIGGAAGQGIQSIGGLLAKFFSSTGLHVFSHQDYMSRIRGGHNFYQIRVADHPLASSRDSVDILLALNRETIELHRTDLNRGGVVLYDPEVVEQGFSGPEFLPVPFKEIAREMDCDEIMVNPMAAGAVIGMLGLELEALPEVIGLLSSVKTETVAATHISAAQAGLEYVRRQGGEKLLTPLKPAHGTKLLLINGNQAIGLGALLSGCKFYSAYPMTPATSIMLFLAAKADKYGIVVEQAEDEIAAVNMAIGASFGGVRAMTGTSGGGFALMAEGLSLAGMTETPIVIAEVQRPGPATGLPTRTEQSDLFFVLFGGHGEFPRVLFTPGTPEQALFLTNKAFHLAEKFQIPVIIQSDQYLADSEWTFDKFDVERLQYENFRLQGAAPNDMKPYKRYACTGSGVSPLAVPGTSKRLVVADSDEHDEDGHIIEDAATRNMMVRKRYHEKFPLIQHEIEPPLLYGDSKAEILLVGYGSTFGVLKEAVDRLANEHPIAMLHFSELWPFPLLEKLDYLGLLKRARLTICVENNATGQFAGLMRMETGFEFVARINKFDGRPFGLDALIGEIDGHLRGL